MFLTEYNEVKTMNLFKAEGKAEGIVEGKAEGFSLFEKIGNYLKDHPDANNEELAKKFDCDEDRVSAVRAFMTR